MSKNISISDDVYRRLKREKGDRSFSEVIEAKLDQGSSLMEVTGNRVLDPDAVKLASDEVAELSKNTMNRIEK